MQKTGNDSNQFAIFSKDEGSQLTASKVPPPCQQPVGQLKRRDRLWRRERQCAPFSCDGCELGKIRENRQPQADCARALVCESSNRNASRYPLRVPTST